MARHENYRSENGGIENSQKSGKQAGEGSAVKRCVLATERGPREPFSINLFLSPSLSVTVFLFYWPFVIFTAKFFCLQ